MIFRFAFTIAFASTLTLFGQSPQTRLIGIDSNYVTEMERRGQTWHDDSGPIDPYQLFSKQGCRNSRVRLWVGDEGTNKLNDATETARRMQQAGLNPYLILFLSDDWADLVKQPVPAVWKNLDSEQKGGAIEAYCERVVRHLTKHKIDIDTFEIGNEIDFGICGEFEEEWPRRVSLEFMRTRIWPRLIPLLKAAQRGVLKAQPKARFIIHLAQWNNTDYCIAFWQALAAAGVKFDYAGLSYFPTSAKQPEQRPFRYLQTQAAKIVAALHVPVLICEAGYPATSEFGGQFGDWKFEVEGYPLSDDGQARWLADFVEVVRTDSNFAGVFYFSPEWYDGGIWDAFSLFKVDGTARPGVRSFQRRGP